MNDVSIATSERLYSIGVWDADKQSYVPPYGMNNCINITLSVLRKRIGELRCIGYSVHRRRDADGTYDDNDWSVIIERTDGQSSVEILEGWER
jgi:hypothetical protein